MPGTLRQIGRQPVTILREELRGNVAQQGALARRLPGRLEQQPRGLLTLGNPTVVAGAHQRLLDPRVDHSQPEVRQIVARRNAA